MFISKKKLEQLLNEKYSEGHKKGYDSGYEKGYGSGLHKGLTSEKKGALHTSNGWYYWDGEYDMYIVIRDQGEYEEREVFIEAIFDSEEKAINYIKEKGYFPCPKIKHTYTNYNNEMNEYEGVYIIEKWSMNSIRK